MFGGFGEVVREWVGRRGKRAYEVLWEAETLKVVGVGGGGVSCCFEGFNDFLGVFRWLAENGCRGGGV